MRRRAAKALDQVKVLSQDLNIQIRRNEEDLIVEDSVDGAEPSALPFTGNSKADRDAKRIAYLNSRAAA
jgi:hypothetical protein